jgi:hypothetical protein
LGSRGAPRPKINADEELVKIESKLRGLVENLSEIGKFPGWERARDNPGTLQGVG